MGTAKGKAELGEEQMRLIARALADPRRYDILRSIRGQQGEMRCAAVLGCSGVSAPTLSHHMKELETAGLVRAVREGKTVTYQLQTEIVAAYLAQVAQELK